MKNKKNLFVTLMLMPIAILAGCSTAGSKNLSKGIVDKIVEGKTTKQEIVKLLGHPNYSTYYDKKTVDEYMHRIYLKRPPEDMFPKDKYEFWLYWKYTTFSGPLPFTNRSVQEIARIIMNSKGVCVKNMYKKKTAWYP